MEAINAWYKKMAPRASIRPEKNQKKRAKGPNRAGRAAVMSVLFGKHEVKSQRVLPSSSLLSDGRGQVRPSFHLPLEGNPKSEIPVNCISFSLQNHTCSAD